MVAAAMAAEFMSITVVSEWYIAVRAQCLPTTVFAHYHLGRAASIEVEKRLLIAG